MTLLLLVCLVVSCFGQDDPCGSFSDSCGDCVSHVACGWCPHAVFSGGGAGLMNVCLNGTTNGPWSPFPGLVACPASIFGNWTFGEQAACPPVRIEWATAGHDESRTYESSFVAPGRSSLKLLWTATIPEGFFSGVLPFEPVVQNGIVSLCAPTSKTLYSFNASSGQVVTKSVGNACRSLSVDSVGVLTSSSGLDVSTFQPNGKLVYRAAYQSEVATLSSTVCVSVFNFFFFFFVRCIFFLFFSFLGFPRYQPDMC